jgi:RHS repeat-associated protein
MSMILLAGGLHDRHPELVRFGFRNYDPYVGRWTAKDPLLFQYFFCFGL